MSDETRRQFHPGAPSREELLSLIIESSTDYAIFAMDDPGIVTYWNSGAERLLGLPEDEILGRPADIIFTPEDRASGAPEQERQGARANGRAEDERWHLRKDGSRFWASGLMMRLADGSGFVKILRDLTPRRMWEEQLRSSEEVFRLLATNIPQLVFLTRGDGERTWGSPQWEAFTGLSLEASLGAGWMDAVHPDDRAATESAWSQAQAEGSYYIEHRLRRVTDGTYRWHQTRAHPVPGAGLGGNWVGTSTDVHELRGLQERQKVLLAELQHRTRNLLAVVHSIARRTMQPGQPLTLFADEFEGRLRALSRVQGLVARIEQSDIDLRELVVAELDAHGEDVLDPSRVHVDGPLLKLPQSSAQALALAIHELATNALKYGALGDPAGRLDVAWRIEEDGSGTRRAVLDWRESGIDMAARGGTPTRRGYGTELIEQALPYQLGAETQLEFTPDGVRCRISIEVEPGERDDG